MVDGCHGCRALWTVDSSKACIPDVLGVALVPMAWVSYTSGKASSMLKST